MSLKQKQMTNYEKEMEHFNILLASTGTSDEETGFLENSIECENDFQIYSSRNNDGNLKQK